MASVNYRLKSRRRRNWRAIIVITVVILLVLSLVFIITGNALKKKSDVDDKDNDSESSSSSVSTKVPSYSVNSYAVDLSSKNYDIVSDAIKQQKGRGATAVSINLNDSSGKLFYSSKIAQSFSFQYSGESTLSLKDVTSRINSSGAIPTAYFNVTAQKETDPKLRLVKLSYEATVIAEAAENGASDITVISDSLNFENAEELISLSENVRSVCDSVTLGVAIPLECLVDPQASVLIEKLLTTYDFIALKLVKNGDSDLNSYIDNTLADPNLRYCFIRYNMRLLFPNVSDDAYLNELREIFRVNSVTNWQMIY